MPGVVILRMLAHRFLALAHHLRIRCQSCYMTCCVPLERGWRQSRPVAVLRSMYVATCMLASSNRMLFPGPPRKEC
eukprot:5135625-Pleurochrysis_carterae.AAC.2